jgi:transcriptional regulator with GAF, ATPase, and Fis domain
VGEIPLEQQAQLLRVLQEGEYERVGEEKLRKVDARIIVATNRDLKKQVEDGRFREDLYFRLNVFPITVPPLRERKEDVPLLANHFLERSLTSMNRPVFRFDQEQLGRLAQYDWPGNVRELQNIVERFAITAHSDSARLEILNSLCADADRMPREVSLGAGSTVVTEEEMVRLQVRNMERALELCRGRIYGPDGAAALLGLKPTTLATRMKKLNVRRTPD